MSFLDQIKPYVYKRIEAMQPIALPEQAGVDFKSIFAHHYPALITEIKFASPSAGLIYQGSLSPIEIAEIYLANGADAISVVTEPHFFKGDIGVVASLRKHFPNLPILLKDFILDPIQIDHAKANGASAVLLIADMVSPKLLASLYRHALKLNLTPLIEVHDEQSLKNALTLNPELIGINNRNLKTLKTDLTTTRKLLPLIPEKIKVISESGLNTLQDLQALVQLGCKGFLIGSALLKSQTMGDQVADFARVKHES